MLFIAVVSALAVPDLPIQRDWFGEVESTDDPQVQSYSGVIKFDDASIPGDKSKMSDGQFINLAKRASEKMHDLWENGKWPGTLLPSTMIAIESEGSMYFASSVKAPQDIDFQYFDAGTKFSPGWFFNMCLMEGWGEHRYGGRCAEPNVLRFYGEQETEPGADALKTPPKTDTSPRIAVWLHDIYQDQDEYIEPCYDKANVGYGCTHLKDQYGFKPVANEARDTTGENDWQFSKPTNVRENCDQGENLLFALLKGLAFNATAGDKARELGAIMVEKATANLTNHTSNSIRRRKRIM